jgi:uncharacterized protein (DUF983 family)
MRKDGHAEAWYISGDHANQVSGGSADICGMCVQGKHFATFVKTLVAGKAALAAST